MTNKGRPVLTLGLLIHVAKIHGANERVEYLYLRKTGSDTYEWYADGYDLEIFTGVEGETVAEAIAKGYAEWETNEFSLVHCGYRYDIQERDDIGTEALFYQMAESYHSGVLIDAMWAGKYNDTELGHNCFVDNASQEALNLMRHLEQEGRL